MLFDEILPLFHEALGAKEWREDFEASDLWYIEIVTQVGV